MFLSKVEDLKPDLHKNRKQMPLKKHVLQIIMKI